MKWKYILQGPLRNEAGEGGEGGGGEGGTGNAGTLPPLMNEDMSFSDGWQGRVGEHAEGSTFKNLPDVLKSNNAATATIRGLNEEKATFATQLEEASKNSGFVPPVIPKTLEEYSAALTLPSGDGIPEGVEVPQELLNKAAEYGMKENISPETVSKFIEFQTQQAGEQFQSEAAAHQGRVQQATATIKQAVGEQNYDTTIANAKAASETLGLQFSAEDLAASTNMVLALANIKSQISSGSLKGASLSDPGANILAGSKLQQAEDIVSNPDNALHSAFMNSMDPQHEHAMNTHSRLISESAL
tara:strand:- start:579 stop:1481 length:903 start_codon:yes stop_codon:yes gene_type:complete